MTSESEKLIVFDFDCTLTINHYFHFIHNNSDKINKAYSERFKSDNIKEFIGKILNENLNQDETDFVIEHFFGGYYRLKILKNLLKKFRRDSYEVLIASRGVKNHIYILLKIAELYQYFDEINYGTNDTFEYEPGKSQYPIAGVRKNKEELLLEKIKSNRYKNIYYFDDDPQECKSFLGKFNHSNKVKLDNDYYDSYKLTFEGFQFEFNFFSCLIKEGEGLSIIDLENQLYINDVQSILENADSSKSQLIHKKCSKLKNPSESKYLKYNDNFFKKYLKYKIKYLDLLQSGGTNFNNVQVGLDRKVVTFNTVENISDNNLKNLNNYFEFIKLKLLEKFVRTSYGTQNKIYTGKFENNISDTDEIMINNVFKIASKGNDISTFQTLKHYILPWFTPIDLDQDSKGNLILPKNSETLFISLNIKNESLYKEKIDKENNYHITLCIFHILNDSELSRNLTSDFDKITEKLKNIIIKELYNKQLQHFEYEKLTNHFAQVFNHININNLRNNLIKELLKNESIHEKDILIYGQLFRFLYISPIKLFTDDDIKRKSYLAQGQYDIDVWKPHVSLFKDKSLNARNEDYKTKLKSKEIKLPERLNLWYSDDTVNSYKGDISTINFKYNEQSINYEFKLHIKKCSKK